MIPETIVEKILPEKRDSEILLEVLGRKDAITSEAIGFNNCREEARQRLLSTYGKEWVGVPSVEEMAKTIFITINGNLEIRDESPDQIASTDWGHVFPKTVIMRKGYSWKQQCIKIAESILKGLKK